MIFPLYTPAGLPLLGASPAFLAYTSGEAPEITELGGGLYSATPAPQDLAQGVAYLIDGGPEAEPRYLAGSLGPVTAVGLYSDETGAPWEGDDPTVTLYQASDGTPLDPPALERVAPGLYAMRPPASDRRAQATYQITAPEGAVPAQYTGTMAPPQASTVVGPTLYMPDGGTVRMKRGDLLPALSFVVHAQDGRPMDLTGRTVRVVIAHRPGLAPVVDAEVEVIDPTGGACLYQWQPGDTDRAGSYRLEVAVFEQDGRRVTLPRDRYGLVEFAPSLGAGAKP